MEDMSPTTDDQIEVLVRFSRELALDPAAARFIGEMVQRQARELIESTDAKSREQS